MKEPRFKIIGKDKYIERTKDFYIKEDCELSEFLGKIVAC